VKRTRTGKMKGRECLSMVARREIPLCAGQALRAARAVMAMIASRGRHVDLHFVDWAASGSGDWAQG